MKLAKSVVVAFFFLLIAPQVRGYGGEDMLKGKPWHHQDITYRALHGDNLYSPQVKFSGGAEAIAWHADFIDSYLYNPLFWGQGFIESNVKDRTKAALIGFDNLAKLHFDDTFSTRGIEGNWERYAAGTLAGLYWASEQGENGDIAAGHHILGVSFHAVQDFYSHSNWESGTDNRCKTYFQTPKKVRNAYTLYSGAYEKPRSVAPAHHGAYSLSCSILRGRRIDPYVGLACGSYSLLQNTQICQRWRSCQNAQSVSMSVAGFTNNNLVYLNPPGIALDNTWLARVQAPNRGLIDSTGSFIPMRDGIHFPKQRCEAIIASEAGEVCKLDADMIFAGGKDVAIRATMEWAEWLEQSMIAMGKGDYWQQLKATPSAPEKRYAQFEDMSKLPYQFLAAGPYPTANPSTLNDQSMQSANGWYLRLRIKTANVLGAGTDSNIYARVRTGNQTQDILLDYLPTNDKTGRVSNRLLVYNDFERGDDDAYMIGPFFQRPNSISLFNDAADSGDLLDALVEDFSNSIDETVTDGVRFLKSFVGGNADFVGSDTVSFTRAQLDQRLGDASWFDGRLQIRGGTEGDHDVGFKVRDMPTRLTAQEQRDEWRAFEVKLDRLKTINESSVDRFSTADEVFIIFHVAPLNGRTNASFTFMTDVIEDVDDGETVNFARGVRGGSTIVKIPPEGALVVSAAIYESDDETMRDRRSLRDDFITGLDEETRRPAREFGDALGRAIAADWEVSSLEVLAFERGAYPRAGAVLNVRNIGEIEGDEESPIWQLDWSKQKTLMGAGVTPILSYEADHPSAREVLEGTWHSDKYVCGAAQAYEAVEISVTEDDENKISAVKTKAEGDQCVGVGEVSFKGEFIDGVIEGERYIVPPPYDRPLEMSDPPGPLDVRPNYADANIHPQIGLEGNWLIQWIGSDSPPAFATLNKGGGWGCVDFPNGGCWYQFTRDEKAPWIVSAWRTDDKSTGSEEVTLNPDGSMTVEWKYYQLGHWGGKSSLSTASDQAIAGSWEYGEKGGGEIWTRIKGQVTHLGQSTESGEILKPLGDPVTLTTQYIGHGYYMRGNRATIYLRLFGENLWGLHRIFIPKVSDLEIGRINYICAPGQYSVHSDWKTCMSQGGVKGIQLSLNVWPQAVSGEHILYFDDQEIPFNLRVLNEPQRYPEWQSMEMEMKSCAVLEEINRPNDQFPFRLVRQDFRRNK